MSMFKLVLRGLRFHWRAHTGALLGASFASAILTGALLVGDSADYSLRSHALSRLGSIHFALQSRGRFFSTALADALAEKDDAPVSAVLSLRGMALTTNAGSGRTTQVNRVNVLGVAPGFWDFGAGARVELGPQEAALNASLAQSLGVKEGDDLSLRIERPSLLSRDAPLSAAEEDTSIRLFVTVKRILPDSGLGRFSLAAEQRAPRNAFLGLGWLQEQVELAGRADMVLVGGGVSLESLEGALRESWQLEDVGLHLRHRPGGVLQLEAERVFLDPAVGRAALTLPGAEGTLAYLVNAIEKDGRSTPYSFALAGATPEGMSDDEVIINAWVAEHIGAKPGDVLHVRYYEIQASNDFVERERGFTVRAVEPMASAVRERALIPEFPGLSDVESCADWDVGMPMDEEALNDKDNEAYWDEFRQTPKIRVTLAAGQDMWGSRFGDLMTVRLPDSKDREDKVREAMRDSVDPAEIGLRFMPVRKQALDAVNKAIDLGGLFLGMSFFLIAAALILIGLLFVFGVQQRAGEMGTLLALGFSRGRVRAVLLGEGAGIALAGAAVGAGAGAGYTRLLIALLARYWQGAVAGAAIQYHAEPGTVIRGAVIAFACALVAMAIAMWRQSRHAARDLLTMDFGQDLPSASSKRHGVLGLMLAVLCCGGAATVVILAAKESSASVTMPFFGAGALLLAGGLSFCHATLTRLGRGGKADVPSVATLALQNASRRRGRSMSVIALLATGCFLVLAVSAMQEDVTAHADARWSGTGGFELFAESTIPLTGDPAASFEEAGADVVPVRVHDGDDASCLNLNHAQTPRLLGVNAETMAGLGAFVPEEDGGALWTMLDAELPNGRIPALVGDTDTLMWGLKKKAGPDNGDLLTYTDETGAEVPVKLVGALPRRLTVFQGNLLVSEKNLTRLYPSDHGYRMFLIDTPEGQAEAVAERLADEFRRFGFEAIPGTERLKQFYTVESTYLAMFLVLGGLGVVLGSAALGIVVLRNLFERRREVATLRAMGFEQGTLFGLLLAEYGALMAGGLLVGMISAAVAMIPAVTSSGTDVSYGLQAAVFALIAATGLACVTLALRVGLGANTTDALRSE